MRRADPTLGSIFPKTIRISSSSGGSEGPWAEVKKCTSPKPPDYSAMKFTCDVPAAVAARYWRVWFDDNHGYP